MYAFTKPIWWVLRTIVIILDGLKWHALSCNYKEPANFDDELHIETYLVKMTRAQMIFRYRMRRASDGALLATGETKNAFMSKSTGKIVRLDDTFYQPMLAAVEEMPNE